MKKLKMLLSSTGAKLRNLGKVIVNGTTVVIGGDYIRYKSSILVFNNGAKLNELRNIKVEDSSVKVLLNNYVTAEGLSKSLMEEKVIEGNFSNIEIKAGL